MIVLCLVHLCMQCAFLLSTFYLHVTAIELKTTRLPLLIDPAKKKAFEQLCAQQDITPSQVVRRLIRDYLATHNVTYAPSGTDAPPAWDQPLLRAPDGCKAAMYWRYFSFSGLSSRTRSSSSSTSLIRASLLP